MAGATITFIERVEGLLGAICRTGAASNTLTGGGGLLPRIRRFRLEAFKAGPV